MNEVLRQEKKYPIDLAQGAALRARLDQIMRRDAHNGAQGYTIRSLYFDTPDDEDFHDKVDGFGAAAEASVCALTARTPTLPCWR